MSSEFEPRDKQFARRVRASFAAQPYVNFLGAELVTVGPGYCEIRLRQRQALRQQHGYIHGGAIASILDSAAGYAAMTLVPPRTGVLTVEYKLNFVRPARGAAIVARGRVVKPGRTLTVVQADAFLSGESKEELCATSIQTLIAIPGLSERAPARRPRNSTRR